MEWENGMLNQLKTLNPNILNAHPIKDWENSMEINTTFKEEMPFKIKRKNKYRNTNTETQNTGPALDN